MSPSRVERCARARMGGKDDAARRAARGRPTIRAQPLGGARSPRGGRVTSTYAAGLEPEPLEDPRPRVRDRREQPGRVGHHVADDLALRRRPPRARAGRPSARRDTAAAPRARSTAIRFRSSGIDRSKLRRPASTWAIGDVARGLRAGEGRVRVAVDEHPVGLLGLDRRADPRHHRRGVGAAQRRAGSAARRGRARRRRPATARGRSAGRCGATTSSIPASRSAADSGADLMNCGRLPTIERTRIAR